MLKVNLVRELEISEYQNVFKTVFNPRVFVILA